MKGIVHQLNARLARYAIQTDQGFTVADLIDGELTLNDEVSGILDEHGEVALKNLTTGDLVEVRIEAFYASLQSAAKLLAN